MISTDVILPGTWLNPNSHRPSMAFSSMLLSVICSLILTRRSTCVHRYLYGVKHYLDAQNSLVDLAFIRPSACVANVSEKFKFRATKEGFQGWVAKCTGSIRRTHASSPSATVPYMVWPPSSSDKTARGIS